MIKVSFKEPEILVQDGLLCECLHVFAFATIQVYDNWFRQIWVSKNEVSHVKESNIKSIENVKPTDL